MLLAIDVGNTNTVFALFGGDVPVAEYRCNTESVRTADQYFVWLSQLMEHGGHNIREITDVVISNVAPATLFNLRVFCDRYFDTRPLVVGKPECALPVDVRVDNPHEVGADRLLIQRDHVLEAMLAGLGAEISHIEAPFQPEGGAYGHGRTHGHAHAHDPDDDPNAHIPRRHG